MAEGLDLIFDSPEEVLAGRADDRLVEAVDRLLDRGVVIRGELWLTVAGIDLVFLGADLLLASPETISPGGPR